MVLHYLPDRSVTRAQSPAPATVADPAGPRAGFVVGKAVGGSVVRHRVSRRLRALVREEPHRPPATADLVVLARSEAADAPFQELRRDLRTGLDRLLPDRVGSR